MTAEMLQAVQIPLFLALISVIGMITMGAFGLLITPTYSGRLWVFAFLAALLASGATVLSIVLKLPDMLAIAYGVASMAPGLVWAGLRARRGVRSLAVWVLGFGVLTAILYLVLEHVQIAVLGDAEMIGGSIVTAVFCVLIHIEWRRSPERPNPIMYPLLYGTATAVVLIVVAEFVRIAWGPGADSMVVSPASIELVGTTVFLVCTIVSLAGFALPSESYEALFTGAKRTFEATAEGRLAIAEAKGEQQWSLVVFRVDDIASIRDAVGAPLALEIGDLLEEQVSAAFPSWADVGRANAVTVQALCPGSTARIREYVKQTLEAITQMEPRLEFTVQLSASAGWVSVIRGGYDLEALQSAALENLQVAEDAGGDRWQRS